MNDIDELKEYVAVHARGQRIAGYRELLGRIVTDEGGGAGSWVGEWCRAAETAERRGSDLEAARHYALARFPFVDGPDRADAQQRGVRAMDRWRREQGGIERLEVPVDGGRVHCWTTGLSTRNRKPLLLVMGGIVTVKEQWAPLLARASRLGMAGVVTELPSVGENTLRYGPDSWRMLTAVLDELQDTADVSQTYAIALSFSGHLALRCAVDDPRLRGVVTVGAPISTFFTDEQWQHRLPRITLDTLAHLTGTKTDEVVGGLGGWALSAEQLTSLDIPVAYGSSLRDEIIPPGEVEVLRRQIRRLDLVENDDVHGSPRHVDEMQLWALRSLLRARGGNPLPAALIGLLLTARRGRRRLTGS